MISTLIKQIMVAHGFTQKEMADELHTSVDRIKGLATGRAKNFTIEESQILVKNLGIRAEWLITGEGSMFPDDDLPSGLPLDEEMLLSAYRDMTKIERKNFLKQTLSGYVATDSVVNQSAHTVHGGQNNAKNQTIHNAPVTTNKSSIKIRKQNGDVVSGDKHVTK